MAVSQETKVGYTVESMQLFLLKTKNMKGVRVDDYFPDRECFSESVRHLLSNKGEVGSTGNPQIKKKKSD